MENNQQLAVLLKRLEQTWYETIPLSHFMAVEPIDGAQGMLSVSAPLPPNINLHQTMFAGSIYTLCTLTGWGAMWLAQQLAGVEGDIVLAHADIKYQAPVTAAPLAKVNYQSIDASPLAEGNKLKQRLEVELWCEKLPCARFVGTYVSLPNKRL